MCAHHHAGFKSDHKNIFSLQDLYFPSLDLPKHRNAAVRRNPMRYTLDTCSVWFHAILPRDWLAASVSQSERGLGRRVGGRFKEIVSCSVVLFDNKQEITIIHADSVLQEERGAGLPGPPGKSVAPLKACSSPQRWHDRFPPSPVPWRIGTIEAQYWDVCDLFLFKWSG